MQVLAISNCRGLGGNLVAPEAVHVYISSCDIKSLDAAKASAVTVSQCTELTTLNCPKAAFVHVNECGALKSTVAAPVGYFKYDYGGTLDLSNSAVTMVHAPEIKKLVLNKCSGLRALHVSACTDLTISGAPELMAVVARAAKVILANCEKLTSVSANTLEVKECPNLNQVKVESLSSIDGMASVKTLSVGVVNKTTSKAFPDGLEELNIGDLQTAWPDDQQAAMFAARGVKWKHLSVDRSGSNEESKLNVSVSGCANLASVTLGGKYKNVVFKDCLLLTTATIGEYEGFSLDEHTKLDWSKSSMAPKSK